MTLDALLAEAITALRAGDLGASRDVLQLAMDLIDELPADDLRRHLVGRMWAASSALRSALAAAQGHLGRDDQAQLRLWEGA
jgi:hypothetical protein